MAKFVVKGYTIDRDETWIDIPHEHHVLSVGCIITGEVVVWFAIDADAESHPMKIQRFATGEVLPHVGSYLGTVLDCAAVWHLFTSCDHGGNAMTEFHYLTSKGYRP